MTSTAAEDPSVLEFEATVDAVDGSAIVLSETYFYPEGGGQPADRGTIDGIEVVDVQSHDGAVIHELEAEPTVDPGDDVSGSIDPAFRTYCMRAHTASHVLYGAGRRLFEDLGYGGFDIGEEKVRVDLRTPSDVDDESLVQLERLSNRAVWDALAVSWEELPREDALAREDVAFNTATEEGVTADAVRIVTIEDWDVAACGGTHVRNTREIGPVVVLERSNPGEGLTRVEFAVGPPAIQRHASERRRAMRAANRLETGVLGLPNAVDRLREERDELATELEQLRDGLLDDRVSALREAAVETDGTTWVVGSLPTDDSNVLAERARAIVGDAVDVVAFVSEDGSYLAVAGGGAVDAEAVVDDVTSALGGGGGGSAAVAQGGGLDATAEEVVAYLRGGTPVTSTEP